MSASTSLGAMLASQLPPRRASRVLRGFPAWLIARLNDSCAPEIQARFGKPIRSDYEAGVLLRGLECGCRTGIFDHYGHDADQNLIVEPYAQHCSACLEFATAFAKRLGARLEVSEVTHHAPGAAVRFTFHEPEVQR